MNTIEFNIKHEYIINKSRFITFLFKINDIEEINNILNNIKTEYKDATHYCYAYIFDNIKRFNDDGEPGGTAGMPILNVLENNSLNYILCVVVRYFGGIKLGAGGLVRAYTNSVTTCLSETNIIKLTEGYKIRITFDYNSSKNIENLIKDSKIINKFFDENITYELLISKETLNKLENICNVEILEKLYI